MGTGRVHGDLVGDGQRGQHPRPIHDDPRVRLLRHGQGDVGVVGQWSRLLGRPVSLQVDQGVGEHQVIFPDVLVIVLDVLLEFGPVLTEIVACGGHRHHAYVQEVRGPSHHAATHPRPVGHHTVAGIEVLRGLGGNERKAHVVAGGGGPVGHLLAHRRVVLQVVQGGDGPDTSRQAGVGGWVGHLLSVHVQGRRPFLEPLDIFPARVPFILGG